MRILAIEDEPRMLELLRMGLQEQGCVVITAMDGETGLEIAFDGEFDAIVLDIGLPRCDGYQIIGTMREKGCATPVLMLTARDGEDAIIRGLELGADDYMTKPFSFAELVARLQSITRPLRRDTDGRIEVADLVIDILRRTVTRGGTPIDLTRSEFTLLAALARTPDRCVSRKALMDAVWGTNSVVGQGTLDVLVNSLRGKIDVGHVRKTIGTVRGSGYILNVSSAQTQAYARELEEAWR